MADTDRIDFRSLVDEHRAHGSIFAGRALHRLRRQADTFQIAYKRIVLVNSNEVINNLTFLV